MIDNLSKATSPPIDKPPTTTTAENITSTTTTENPATTTAVNITTTPADPCQHVNLKSDFQATLKVIDGLCLA